MEAAALREKAQEDAVAARPRQAAPEEEALLAPHQAAARALVEQERQPVPPAAPARRDCILHIGPCGPQAEKPP